jgi:hypothetical protein
LIPQHKTPTKKNLPKKENQFKNSTTLKKTSKNYWRKKWEKIPEKKRRNVHHLYNQNIGQNFQKKFELIPIQ